MKKNIYLLLLTLVLSVFTTSTTFAATPSALKNTNKTGLIKISDNNSQSQIDFLKFKREMNSFLDKAGKTIAVKAPDGTTRIVKTSLIRAKLNKTNNVGKTAVVGCFWDQIKFDYYYAMYQLFGTYEDELIEKAISLWLSGCWQD